MGFDDGRIILDREDETYFTGQLLRGRLEFNLSEVKKFRGIYVEFKGFCKVHWTTSHSRRENDRTVHYTVAHNSHEDYINACTYLVGGKSGENQLHPGSHVFPFEFQIPPHGPSSFEGSVGHVRYKVKVTVDRAFKLDQHKTAQIRVLAPLDLNMNPYCKEPIGMEFYKSYCCWCMTAGKSEVTVKVPAGGAVPGQVLPIELSCKNNSTVKIKAIRFKIKQDIVYRAEYEPDTREDNDTILEVKKGPVPGHTERNWVVELVIPDMDVPNMLACRFIDCDYKIKVNIETSGCHEDDDETRPFIIGTIPLATFQTQPIAPTENTSVSSYPPIMNQPIAGNIPYPNVAPYHDAPLMVNNQPQNTPYPVPSYPGANPPYPGANPPYPSANPPYPGANPPYPGANPPFLGANPPYPNTSPYPSNPFTTTNVGNAPYPTQGTSPYPTPNVPANPPYPTDTNAPYPNVTPYPPTSVPYGSGAKPQFTGTTLLKTGNFGFIEQGNLKDSTTKPLLPSTTGVPPYPTSPFASPSAPSAPSAPVPSTPDADGRILCDDLPTNNSPFNPEFKDKP